MAALTPEERVEVERELERARDDLARLRNQRVSLKRSARYHEDRASGFASSLDKVETSIGANERAVERLDGLLREAA